MYLFTILALFIKRQKEKITRVKKRKFGLITRCRKEHLGQSNTIIKTNNHTVLISADLQLFLVNKID